MSERLVCFSPVRWDAVRGRPHHLATRLGARWPLLFVEPPRYADVPTATLERARVGAGVDVVQPVLPAWAAADAALELVARELDRGADGHILWLWTPDARIAEAIRHDVLVYDALDDPAVPPLPEPERALLERADVVFAGGPSRWQEVRRERPDAHLVPNGVEQSHFGAARLPAVRVPQEILALPRPVLGFFGALDARLDLELVRAVALARPKWSVALVGPLVGLEADALPQAPNLHYLGAREYVELPGYLRGFDVCLLPYRMDETTRYLSPGQPLEYMAAHKPVITMPIHDVLTLFGEVVRVAEDAPAVVREVEAALKEGGQAKKERVGLERRLLETHGWDATTRQMIELVEQALAAGRATRLEAAG